MTSVRRLLPGLVLIVTALALGGCISASDVAHMIVTAPNQQGSHSDLLGQVAAPLYIDQFKVAVGPPPATLALAVVAPRNYGFSASEKWKKNREALVLKWRIRAHAAGESGNKSEGENTKNLTGAKAFQYMRRMLEQAIPKLPICPATGTVILLPGWGETKETLIGLALDFANHGYRVVLVDLRGQGESTGKYVTYGLIEHRDISQVISALYDRNLVVGKLALVGVSEGATVALDTAAADPRVGAVVAVAPFVNLKTAIRGVGNFYIPTISKAVSKEKLAQALVIADQRVGMNLANADPSSRVGNIEAPVLYIAGGKDKIAPATAVKALAGKTPSANFLEIPRYPHIALYFGVAKVGPPTLDALSKVMGLSPDPACLAQPPPKNVHYDFPFTFTLTKR